MEEQKEIYSRVCDEDDDDVVITTKNPIFYLQQSIKAILKCLGFESSKLVDHQSSSSSSLSTMCDTNSKKEEESEKQEQECVDTKQGSNSTNDNYKNDEDPPQSQTLIEAAKRGKPPQRSPVDPGPPPVNN